VEKHELSNIDFDLTDDVTLRECVFFWQRLRTILMFDGRMGLTFSSQRSNMAQGFGADQGSVSRRALIPMTK
jgi:hypothetical protein